jgi:hypothetical protein
MSTGKVSGAGLWYHPKTNLAVTVHGQASQQPAIVATQFTDLVPRVSDVFAVGNADRRWRRGRFGTGGLTVDGELLTDDLYVDGTVDFGTDGQERVLDITGDVTIGDHLTVFGTTTIPVPAIPDPVDGDLLPSATNKYDVGKSGNRWAQGYFVDSGIRRSYIAGDMEVVGDVSLPANVIRGTTTFEKLISVTSGGVSVGGNTSLDSKVTAATLAATQDLTVTGNSTVAGNTSYGTLNGNNTHTITGDVHFAGPVNVTGSQTGYSPTVGHTSGFYDGYVWPLTVWPPQLLAGAASGFVKGQYVKVGTRVFLWWRLQFQRVSLGYSNGEKINFDIPLPPGLGHATGNPQESNATGFASCENELHTGTGFIDPDSELYQYSTNGHYMKNALVYYPFAFSAELKHDYPAASLEEGQTASYALLGGDYARYSGDGLFLWSRAYDGGFTEAQGETFSYQGFLSYDT